MNTKPFMKFLPIFIVMLDFTFIDSELYNMETGPSANLLMPTW